MDINIFTLSNGQDATQWFAVNDDVMGGRSTSSIVQLPDSIQFAGQLSKKNNGGFASMRRLVRPPANPTGFNAFALRASGDGQVYQLRARLSDNRLSYAASFVLPQGQTSQLKLPFNSLVPTFRGRTFQLAEATAFNLSFLESVSILVGNKQEGPFCMELISLSLQ